MKAGRAYISSLGTTVLLVASSLLLLAVLGTLFAFDRWPSDSRSDAADVLVTAGHTARAREVVAKREARARVRDERRRAAERRRARARLAARRREVRFTKLAGGGVVVSDLPAPVADTGGASGGAGGSTGPPGGGLPGGGSGDGGETTRRLGDTVAGVNPQAGVAVVQVAGVVDDAATHVAPPSLSP